MRRFLELGISLALAATAVWAGVTGVDALISWRFEAEELGLRPGRAGDDVALAAIAIASIVRIVTMLGKALAVLPTSSRPPRRSDDPELASHLRGRGVAVVEAAAVVGGPTPA